ncbi:two-component system, sporulation sensor kinase A [Mariprofundus micogutta]|uniref:histidine kinase n=1 Tax=Mariprofundus micogutta TaxID=1921010 RepID=A0A1L8CKJ8_9PROT|nr:PAS domain S-box protein [Mariprofundus micogutta]GAV19415.1 two-component system, sporulation sensor kinase A [Mariprofundus micogutta]
MNDDLEQKLLAANETIGALRKRLMSLEGGGDRTPFQQQLKAYQDRIEEEQHKLRLSQAWAHLLVENSMDAIVGMNDQGIITHWNPRAASMFGWLADEATGRPFSEVVIHKMPQGGALPDSTHYSGDESSDGNLVGQLVEVNGSHRDGSPIPLELLLSVMKSQGQKQFVAILRDISERKKTEAALQVSHENLERQVQERTQELLDSNALLTDAQKAGKIGTFTFDLKRACWTSSEMLDAILGIETGYNRDIKGWLDIVHPGFRHKIWKYLKREALKGSQTLKIEVKIRRRNDGQQRWIQGYGRVMKDAAGRPERLIGTVQDITESKQFEEHFLQTQKMEAVGTLVGGVAHEFNNMLAGMTGRLYLAKLAVQNNNEALDHLGKIEGLSFKAAEMIQQLLTFSRKGQVTKKTFDLVMFIKEAFKLHRFSIPENIRMNTSFSQYALPVDGDEVQMQQILVNLLNNARDALEKVNKPVIDIRLELYEQPLDATDLSQENQHDRFAHLSVSDNGCGMSAETRRHIFEPFFTTKDVGKGTGLGLAMLYGAVETHQGRIEVESEPGRGSIFNIYFPLSEAATQKLTEQPGLPLAGRGETILLVDDEANLRMTGAEVLTRMGYHVLQAADGLEAVEEFIANEDDVAVILMDIVMPNLGGVAAAQEIWKRNSNVKVIFCTGYDKEEVTDEKDLRGSAFISKPYRVDELGQLIRNMI